jgi:flagellar basal-body rod protein FlgG
MMAQQMRVDSIANNIANVNTTAFKANRLSFRSLLYKTLREPGAQTNGNQTNPTGLQVGSGTEVAGSVKVFAQGDLEPSSNPLDVGIQGEGFFKLVLPNGEFRYTRDGSFRKDGNGEVVNSEGLRLDPSITLPDDAISLSIGLDGQVEVTTQGNPTPSQVGQILVTRFANPAGLKAVGGNLFEETVSSGTPTDVTPGSNGAGVVRQSFLERSNVAVVEELIELIQAQRNYEVNSRTIRVSDEMLQQVGNLIQ